ncbi:MAG TPA: TetR/AcrR family transcriptional regulator [Rhodospirillales bacterium]|nr:TetR/AcrR family transcriptional regulator [Rhodospirillales bacterium]
MVVPPNKRFTIETWLELGLAVLGDAGVCGLSIERICAFAGKTRGSFYHHFADHNEFVVAVLEHWQKSSTASVIAAVVNVSDSHAQRKALARQVAELSSASENAIRGWAGTDERARRVVQKVDQSRLDFLEQGIVALAAQAGIQLTGPEAQRLALLDYGLFIGIHALRPGETADYYLKLNELSENMLKAWMDKRVHPD